MQKIAWARPELAKAKVKRVIDGDTLLLQDGRRVRLIGIDTPELHASDKLDRDAAQSNRDRRTIQKLGKRSRDVVEKLLGKGGVVLEYGDERFDRHHRTLAYVFFRSTEQKLRKAVKAPDSPEASTAPRDYMLNSVLVEYGYANVFTSYPFKHSREFIELERRARKQGRGLWKAGSPAL